MKVYQYVGASNMGAVPVLFYCSLVADTKTSFFLPLAGSTAAQKYFLFKYQYHTGFLKNAFICIFGDLEKSSNKISFPVAQLVEHGTSNAKIMGSIPRESKS